MNIDSRTRPIKTKPIKIDWKKILIVAVILGIAGYKWYQENKLEQKNDVATNSSTATVDDDRYDAKLPDDFGAKTNNSKSSSSSKSNSNKYDAKLPKLDIGSTAPKDDNSFRSKSGLKQSKSATQNKTAGKQPNRNQQASSREFLTSIGRNKLQSPAGLIYGMGGGGEHRVDHVMRHGRDDTSRPSHGVFEGDKDAILAVIDEAYEMIKSKSKYVKSEESRGNMAYTISMGKKIGHEGGQKGKRNNHRPLKSVRLILDGNKVITAYPYR